MAVVGSGRCIGMIDLMITQLSCWLDPSIWLLYILYAAVALSSLIHLAELSCQPEGHGHLAASCLSTCPNAHTHKRTHDMQRAPTHRARYGLD
jgi:hypothetical protein